MYRPTTNERWPELPLHHHRAEEERDDYSWIELPIAIRVAKLVLEVYVASVFVAVFIAEMVNYIP